jgi:STAS domain.
MKIDIRSFEKWYIVSLEGKFIVKYIAQVRKVIEPLEKMEQPLVAFDFSATTHMDSSAITLIMNYNRRLVAKKGKLVLFGANEDITGIINIVGLDSTVPLYKTHADFELSVRLKNI